MPEKPFFYNIVPLDEEKPCHAFGLLATNGKLEKTVMHVGRRLIIKYEEPSSLGLESFPGYYFEELVGQISPSGNLSSVRLTLRNDEQRKTLNFEEFPLPIRNIDHMEMLPERD